MKFAILCAMMLSAILILAGVFIWFMTISTLVKIMLMTVTIIPGIAFLSACIDLLEDWDL